MNATTVNERLLAGDKVMPEMYLKQSGFTYSARRSFTENKKRKKKWRFNIYLSKRIG